MKHTFDKLCISQEWNRQADEIGHALSKYPGPDMALWVGVILGFLFIVSTIGILAWAVLRVLT